MGLFEAIAALLSGMGNTVGIRAGTEEPRYAVVDRIGTVEVRQYGPRLAAEATVSGDQEAARNEGFRKVAGYIFGGNEAKTSIAMTAPVAQSAAGGSRAIAMTMPVVQAGAGAGAWTIQFFMPAKFTRETLPAPKDPAVRIVEVPGQTYAVLRFSGARDGKAVATRTAQLKAMLTGSQWRASGEPVAWFYDPPWTLPPLRRNEVAAPVTRP